MNGFYPWVLAIGAALGLLWLGLAPTDSPDSQERIHRIDAGLAALGGGLLGARLGFVIAHLPYFAARPVEVLYVSDGGLSWVGASLGALAGVAAYCAASRSAFWPTIDALAVPALLVGAAAWSGCLIDACAYGRPAEGFLPAPDMVGTVESRWPTQTIGAVAALLGVGWLTLFITPMRSGRLGALALAMLSASTLALAFVRGDPVPELAGLRLDGVSSALVLAAAAALFVLRGRE